MLSSWWYSDEHSIHNSYILVCLFRTISDGFPFPLFLADAANHQTMQDPPCLQILPGSNVLRSSSSAVELVADKVDHGRERCGVEKHGSNTCFVLLLPMRVIGHEIQPMFWRMKCRSAQEAMMKDFLTIRRQRSETWKERRISNCVRSNNCSVHVCV